mmetsp:Transcript_4409/g.6704  ORF Transcript_4409/g.6704 Transcript_4409/m.6704 type:complete len:87 (+) Transcript_4409:1-261(+)
MELKQVIRPEDPMAKYMKVKIEKKVKTSSKLLYKGPPPKPNRFGIMPGYRWDGVDRGNSWEEKLTNFTAERKSKDQVSRQWAVMDL